MTSSHRLVPSGLLALAVLASGLVSSEIAAQQGTRPDFLFERPFMSFTIRGGVSLPTANSEIFDFTSEQLTIDTDDFYAPSIGAEFSFRITERVDVAVGVSVSQSKTVSEFREFVGDDDLPILQTTEFIRVPTTLSLKYYLSDRGRSIGRFAWVVSKFAPYVGVGGGVTWHQFEQRGEWVDYESLDIYADIFKSDGATGVGHVLAGADISLWPRWFLSLEGRYSIANAGMTPDFVNFDNIDLGGFDVTLGAAIRF